MQHNELPRQEARQPQRPPGAPHGWHCWCPECVPLHVAAERHAARRCPSCGAALEVVTAGGGGSGDFRPLPDEWWRKIGARIREAPGRIAAGVLEREAERDRADAGCSERADEAARQARARINAPGMGAPPGAPPCIAWRVGRLACPCSTCITRRAVLTHSAGAGRAAGVAALAFALLAGLVWLLGRSPL